MSEKEENKILNSRLSILNSYHVPVMLKECIEGLNINPGGIYADLTFGGGGHSGAIAEKLDKGKLYAFDQDEDATANYESLIDIHPEYKERLILVKANFRHFKKYLKLYGIDKVDGILADLGVSSHQFDTAERGFSFRFDADLDMRMNRTTGKSAAEVVNEYPEEQLHKIFGMYGEIQNARTLAQTVARERINKSIVTTADLKTVTSKLAKRGQENKYNAQVFQALRIEVNDEIKALEEMLEQTGDVLKPGGRLVIMTYHSLEDRLVKNYIKQGKLYGEAEKDLYGNVDVPFESITRKPVEATEKEVLENNRARSAKLRIAERL